LQLCPGKKNKKLMRILLSAYACRPNAGSEPGVGWSWATHLAARGIEVHVLVAQRNQEPIETGLRAKPISNLHFTYVSVPYKWAKHNEALHYVWWQFAALKAARSLTKKTEFQLAHHVTYASVHVPSQLWRLGIPVVFGPVGGGQTAPANMLSYFGKDKRKERLRSLLTKRLEVSAVHARYLKRMSFILAANCDTLKVVQALGCENASLMCDTAIPSDYFAEAPHNYESRTGALKLLWVGRMLARKALPLALDSLKKVNADVTLTIAGDGLLPDIVRQMIRERNLQHRVFWKGSRLTHEELRKAYQEHDAMLFTSLRDSFGSQVLEAMAMGLPIIALDLHGVRDWVPEGAALKVAVSDTQDTVRNLANAIETYASLSALHKNQMAAHAWNFAKMQNWPARAEWCESLYQNILLKTAASRSDFPLHGVEAEI
jgi:glycosyltransferase involved in cell wall biosynthesis